MEILSDATFKGKIIAENELKVPAENLKLFYNVADLSNGSNDYVRFGITEFYNGLCSNSYTPTLMLTGLRVNRLNVGSKGINLYDGNLNIIGSSSCSECAHLSTSVAKITEFVINENSKFTRDDGNYGNNGLTFPSTLTEFYRRGVNPYEIVVNNKLDKALNNLSESYQKKDCSTVFRDLVDINFDIAASCTKFSVDMPWESTSCSSGTMAVSGSNIIDLKMTKGTNPISPVNIDLEARCDSTTGNSWKIIATKSSSFAMSSADNYKIHILGVKPY